MTPRPHVLPGAVLAAVLLCAACAPQGTPGVGDDEVALGITAPLSGPAAAWGAIAQGAAAWAEHVNAQGGVHGRRLRAVLKDDAYTPGRAVANVAEMEGEVLAMVGTIGTAVINAIKDAVAESGLPVVLPFANVRVWAAQPREAIERVFVAYPDYQHEGEFLGEQVAAAAGAGSAAVFYQNDDFGRDGLEGLKRGFDGAGVELLDEVPYELQDRELGLHALRLKESGAEAVVLYSTPTHAANLINEMAKLDYRPALFSAATLSDEQVMFRLLGESWSGVYVSYWAPPASDPERRRVTGILLEQDPSLEGRELFAVLGATAMMVAVEGLQRAGPQPTRESFVAALESLSDFRPAGFAGPIRFGPDRHHGFNAVALMRMGAGPEAPPERIAPLEELPPLF